MMAGSKLFRNRASLPFRGTRVLRVLQEPRRKTLFRYRLRIAQNVWQEPDYCVQDRHRRKFATGNHEVSDADLLDFPRLEDALVDSLVATA